MLVDPAAEQPQRASPATERDAPFYQTLDRYGDRIALIDGEDAVSYRALAQDAKAIARALGSRRSLVFLEARNTARSVAAYLACLIGGHPVYLYAAEDRDQAAGLARRYGAHADVRADGTGALAIERLSDAPIELHPDLRVLLSTSGSTGSPKFVKLSSRNIDSNAASIAQYLALSPADRAATSLKFNYSYGLSVINSHLVAGGSLWLTGATVASDAFFGGLRERGCTSFAGVPYTFELLRTMPDEWARIASLRYVTQAGGKLAPPLVAAFAALGARHGWDLFVMYGQTEAAPRIAFLPPAMAADHPDCIGRAIPGGTLALRDAHGAPVTGANVEGELVYRGPNVMMGYAEAAEHLATDETPADLLTGDIAVRTDAALFRIVGRTSRFVKPFGLRTNLDDVQAAAREVVPDAVATGTDETIVIAAPAADLTGGDATADLLQTTLAGRFRLPAASIKLLAMDEIPRLSNGKPDYRAILVAADLEGFDEGFVWTLPVVANVAKAMVTPRFIGRVLREAAQIAGLTKSDWSSVADIYGAVFAAKAVMADSTFQSLAGDSLTYVQVSMALEDYLGHLPDGWDGMTVVELEGTRGHAVGV